MIKMYENGNNTVTETCKFYDISRPSFYNSLKRIKEGKYEGVHA